MKMNYLKSPFNYTGAKWKLLPQILPLFPEPNSVDRFFDVFSGGGSVFMNCPYDRITANDVIKPLMDAFQAFRACQYDEIHAAVSRHVISKDDQEAYNRLREEFNHCRQWPQFFCLVSACTNNMMRFSKSFKFNQTFGRRTVNDNTWAKLDGYIARIKEIKDLELCTGEFDAVLPKIGPRDFVYMDPPYLITDAGYNCYWSAGHEERMRKFCLAIHEKGARFAMSNVRIHKGREYDWCRMFEGIPVKAIDIDCDYSKVARRVETENNAKTREILVVNYGL